MRVHPKRMVGKCEKCKHEGEVLVFGEITAKNNKMRCYCSSCMKRPRWRAYD